MKKIKYFISYKSLIKGTWEYQITENNSIIDCCRTMDNELLNTIERQLAKQFNHERCMILSMTRL